MAPSESQRRALIIITRSTASLSLVSSVFVVASFLLSNCFKTPINRLIFYATWGNIMINISTFINVDGVKAGAGSSLCLSQSFFIQWFFASDVCWNLCLACNVYFTIFRRYSTSDLRRLEFPYFLFSYGVPFIPAFVLFFIHTEERGYVYGPAVLWCWVSSQWRYLQVVVLYGPAWTIIVFVFTIYIAAGIRIYCRRRQVLKFAARGGTVVADGIVRSNTTNATPAEPCGELSSVATGSIPPQLNSAQLDDMDEEVLACHSSWENTAVPLSSHGGVMSRPRSHLSPSSLWHKFDRNHRMSVRSAQPRRRQSYRSEASSAYVKYASLVFISLIVVWIPSSVNRLLQIFQYPYLVFGLLVTQSVAGPLHALFNSLVYIITSWDAFRSLMNDTAQLIKSFIHSLVPNCHR
ncbi:hypothetical protein GGI35DRAFT_465092 [Trichoderma velutinum]